MKGLRRNDDAMDASAWLSTKAGIKTKPQSHKDTKQHRDLVILRAFVC